MMNSFVIPAVYILLNSKMHILKEMYILINFENIMIHKLHFKVNNQCYRQCDVKLSCNL